MDIATVDFCGFKDVHQGFKDKLMAMLERASAAYNVRMACAKASNMTKPFVRSCPIVRRPGGASFHVDMLPVGLFLPCAVDYCWPLDGRCASRALQRLCQPAY